MQSTHMKAWEIVALVLEKVLANMPYGRVAEPITIFHAMKIPSVSLYNYLGGLSYVNCSESCFIVAFVYIDRIIQKNPMITISPLSIHRLMLASLLLAIKFNDDTYYNNAFYAKMGGISLEELNYLEIGILSHIRFDLYINQEVYNSYEKELRSHCVQAQTYMAQPIEADECAVKNVPRYSSYASVETSLSNADIPEKQEN